MRNKNLHTMTFVVTQTEKMQESFANFGFLSVYLSIRVEECQQ